MSTKATETKAVHVNRDIVAIHVDEKEIPSLIRGQLRELDRYKKSVDSSIKQAGAAIRSAEKAKESSTGLFQKKDTIEKIQGAVADSAEALGAFAASQKISFEYQQKLGECCKYLFGLGVSNIATNRSVVRELEMRLQGASKEELDELARQEIFGVIQQLKAQEDMMKKQNDLTGKVRVHDGRINELEGRNKEQNLKIYERISYDKQQDKRIEQNAELGRELDERLSGREKKDESQDAEIARQIEKDTEHDKRLDEGEKKDEVQDAEIARQAAKDAEHDSQISVLKERIQLLEEMCESLKKSIIINDEVHVENEELIKKEIDSRFTRKQSIVSAAVGLLGLIAAIVSFIL